MTKRGLVIAAIALGPVGCTLSATPPENRAALEALTMPGPIEAASGHPAVGALLRGKHSDPTWSHPLCTSTLVGPREVLTAKHCIAYAIGVEHDDLRLLVEFGAETSGGPDRAMADVLSWDLAADDDIALLHLTSDVPIEPAAIASGDVALGCDAEATGYGLDSEQQGIVDRPRHEAKSIQACVLEVATMVHVQASGPIPICSGDSGGPLFQTGTQTILGVLSSSRMTTLPDGTRDCVPGGDAFYTPAAAVHRLLGR